MEKKHIFLFLFAKSFNGIFVNEDVFEEYSSRDDVIHTAIEDVLLLPSTEINAVKGIMTNGFGHQIPYTYSHDGKWFASIEGNSNDDNATSLFSDLIRTLNAKK